MRARNVRIERKIKEAPVLFVGANFEQDNMRYKLLTIQRVDIDHSRGTVTVHGTGRPLAHYSMKRRKKIDGEVVALSGPISSVAFPIGD